MSRVHRVVLASALLAGIAAAFAPLADFPAGAVINPLAAQEKTEENGFRQIERPGRTGLPLPRFVSLRNDEVNLRAGPGIRYPIEWVYRRRGLPVEVIDEFENWRRIRDWEGTLGWVHQSMLSGRRTVRITGEESILRRRPDAGAPGVATLMPGAIGRLLTCKGGWCEIEIGGYEGWVKRSQFYGVFPREEFE